MSNGLVANFLIFVAADWDPSEKKKLEVGQYLQEEANLLLENLRA